MNNHPPEKGTPKHRENHNLQLRSEPGLRQQPVLTGHCMPLERLTVMQRILFDSISDN